MQGCFLDAGSVGADLDWARLEHALEDWTWHHNTAADTLGRRLAGAHVAVVNKVVLDAQTIAQANALRLICVAATGVNNVDLEAAAARGIPVINVSDYAAPAVSQHVLALLLAFATRWRDYDTAVRTGAWSRSEFFCVLDYPIEELAGQALGLVGYGTLAAAVAERARAFDMRILIAERPGAASVRQGRMAFEQVLEQADAISLHCPLTPATERLIDAAALARMKPTAVLINTARGAIVDSAALAAALRAGTIAGAAVDVLETEPPPADHPLLCADLPNLIVTPHSAWASRGARQRVIDGVAGHIEAFRAGDASARV